MISIKLKTDKFNNKVERLKALCQKHIDRAFYEIILKARLAMETKIIDYPGFTNEKLQEFLEEKGIAPKPGLLKDALQSSMDLGTKTVLYGGKLKRDVINLVLLNSLTPWNGINGKRPILRPNYWKENPYSGYGFWRLYNDGFTWDDGQKIMGRNFIFAGTTSIVATFEQEIGSAVNKIFQELK